MDARAPAGRMNEELQAMESDWVDLRCTWLDEARWLKSVLDAAGIDAVIPDEHTLGLPLAPEREPGAVRLLVRSTDVERALDALDHAPGASPSLGIGTLPSE